MWNLPYSLWALLLMVIFTSLLLLEISLLIFIGYQPCIFPSHYSFPGIHSYAAWQMCCLGWWHHRCKWMECWPMQFHLQPDFLYLKFLLPTAWRKQSSSWWFVMSPNRATLFFWVKVAYLFCIVLFFLGCTMWFFQRCTTWWFHVCLHCDMIIIIKVISTSITHFFVHSFFYFYFLWWNT